MSVYRKHNIADFALKIPILFLVSYFKDLDGKNNISLENAKKSRKLKRKKQQNVEKNMIHRA